MSKDRSSERISQSRESYVFPYSDEVQQLLTFVTSLPILSAGLMERRQQLITKMAEWLNADVVAWNWGYGTTDDGRILPVAIIDHGLSNEQKAFLAKTALDRKSDLEFRSRIIALLDPTRQVTVLRDDVYPDEEWDAYPLFRHVCDGLGLGSWVLSVRYSLAGTWTNLTMWRTPDREPFGLWERDYVQLAMKTVSWLCSSAEEAVPAETLASLTPRQRGVLVLLLDGMSRKAVARYLNLTENTVGDHIKSIYQNFGVHSLGELIAKLLKSS